VAKVSGKTLCAFAYTMDLAGTAAGNCNKIRSQRLFSGITRGRRGGPPWWHHPGGDTRVKKIVWLNLQRTLDNTISKDGSCGVVTIRQLKKVIILY